MLFTAKLFACHYCFSTPTRLFPLYSIMVLSVLYVLVTNPPQSLPRCVNLSIHSNTSVVLSIKCSWRNLWSLLACCNWGWLPSRPAAQLSSLALLSPVCWVFPPPLSRVGAHFLAPTSLFFLDYFPILVSTPLVASIGKGVHRKQIFWGLERKKISLSCPPT